MQLLLKQVRPYWIYFFKWTALALLTGGLCGAVGALFHHAVELAGGLFSQHGWLLYLLPVAGLALVWFYRLLGAEPGEGANLVIVSLHGGAPVSLLTALRIFVGTVLTHLCGGSAGREGAALLIGAGIVSPMKRLFRLSEQEAGQVTRCGMAGLFSAVFGTPVTAALFSIEVSAVGELRYTALYPCLVSSLAAWQVSSLLATEGVQMPAVAFPSVTLANLGLVAVLALLCALCAIVFLGVVHGAGSGLARLFPSPYVRIAAGGAAVVVLTLLLGRDYNGAGMSFAVAAVSGQAVAWAFAAKILLTALTIGAGYKGGEIVPAFFVGATFGCTVGPLLGLDAGFAAAIGLVALFCGVVNCPVASLVLAVELFGGGGLGFFAVACGICYIMSGYCSLYKDQKFADPKPGERLPQAPGQR